MIHDYKYEVETRHIELVATSNISRAIKRVMKSPGYDQRKWKRAILNGMALAGCSDIQLEKVRIALELP